VTFSGKICIIKSLFLWKNKPGASKMWKFSGGGPPDSPFLLQKLSMTVEINQKKLYYNHYTSGKFLILKFKFKVKSSDTPSPNFRCLATFLTPSVHGSWTKNFSGVHLPHSAVWADSTCLYDTSGLMVQYFVLTCEKLLIVCLPASSYQTCIV
jgi:hypothetical protein